MKKQNEMRSEFEKLEEIEELRKEFEIKMELDLKEFKYSKSENIYTTREKLHGIDFIEAKYECCKINGAWWMFQELRK